MIFSFKELKHLAGLHATTTISDVVQVMNSIGFEVTSVKDFAPVKNVMFGEIINITKNPQATNLNVCAINFKDKTRIIQTSAANVHVGMIVAAFIPGSSVGNLTFAAKVIQGIVSEGMLTNPAEFGIDANLLRAQTQHEIYGYQGVAINDDVNEVLGLDDKLIDVELLSNRADAASYYVMAMEIAACFGKKAEIPKMKIGSEIATRKVAVNKAYAITFIEAKNNFHISIREELLLAKHGIKAINNAVDLSNLALVYAGLPVHIYDATKVGQTLSVDFSSAPINVLGNKQVTLHHNLVVHDETQVISVASVVGLETTKVEADAPNLLIEAGIFPRHEIRKSLQTIKLDTHAAKQGIKNTSHGTLQLALIYLTNKLQNFSNIINLQVVTNKVVKFDAKILNQIAGMQITQTKKYARVIQTLINLGFVFYDDKVLVPLYRYDIVIQADLHEEIFRFYGYANFMPRAPHINTMPVLTPKSFKQQLQAQGYSEVRTYALVARHSNTLNPWGFEATIKLKTFVSNERVEIRNSQVISLLEIANYNYKQGFKNLNIFSKGMINNDITTIAMLSSTKDFYKLQSDLVHLLPGMTCRKFKTNDLHPKIATQIILHDHVIGWIGKVHPRDAKEDYMLAEFITNDYMQPILFQKYNQKPITYQDINIFVKENEDLANYLQPYKNKFKVELIDKYQMDHATKITIRVYDKA